MIPLCVGGECFVLSMEHLCAVPDSLLWKCFHPSSPLRMKPHADDGSYHFDRDPAIFRHVVVPYLRTQSFSLPESVSPLDALKELDYFGLSSVGRGHEHPDALDEREAKVVCKVMVDRLARTMGGKGCATFIFFSDELSWNVLQTSFNILVYVTTLSTLFRSTALVEHGLDVGWSLHDVSVYQCPLRKEWRVSKDEAPVLAYTNFMRATVTDVSHSHLCTVKATDVSPSMYFLDVRECIVEVGGEGGAPVSIHVTIHYDLLQRHVVVGCRMARKGPWSMYASYYSHFVVVRKGAAAPHVQDEASTYTYLISSCMVRLFDGQSVRHGEKGVSFPCADYDVYVVVYQVPLSMETLVSTECAKGKGLSKILRTSGTVDKRREGTTTRTVCRLRVVALTI